MCITPQQALERIIRRQDLSQDEMIELMRQMLRGDVPEAATSAILIGLRVKRETIAEITGAAYALRECAQRIPVANTRALVDIVGTGGDGLRTFNISTCAMFVVAAAGGCVAKHGSRSVTSKSGSADVLEALDARIDLQPEAVARIIDAAGVGFVCAPTHHPALQKIAPLRRMLGVRTLFNILGPLANPARPPNIVLGVFHFKLVPLLAQVLQNLGVARALVVHGRDGMDELSIGASSLVAELRDGVITEYEVHPEDFSIPMASCRHLQVDSPQQSCERIHAVLAGQQGPLLDVVVLNAGAALYVSGVANDWSEGIAKARDAIHSGLARAKLAEYLAQTHSV